MITCSRGKAMSSPPEISGATPCISPNVFPHALAICCILWMTGKLWITKFTALRCRAAKSFAWPRIPYPKIDIVSKRICMACVSTCNFRCSVRPVVVHERSGVSVQTSHVEHSILTHRALFITLKMRGRFTLYPRSTSSSVTISLILFHFSWCCSIQTWLVHATCVPNGFVKTNTSPWTAWSDWIQSPWFTIELTWPLMKHDGFNANFNHFMSGLNVAFLLINYNP